MKTLSRFNLCSQFKNQVVLENQRYSYYNFLYLNFEIEFLKVILFSIYSITIIIRYLHLVFGERDQSHLPIIFSSTVNSI
jgi:hypothetical protein